MKKLYFFLTALLIGIAANAATVYFLNDASWSAVNVYTWTGSNPTAGWPGDKLATVGTQTNITVNGVNLYSYTTDATIIIFSSDKGSPQTQNLKVVDNAVYNASTTAMEPYGYVVNGQFSKSEQDTTDYLYLRGVGGDWACQPQYRLTPNENQTVWTISNVDFTGGQEFKIANAGWDGAKTFTSNNKSMTLGTYNNVPDGGNMAFASNQSGVTVTLNSTTGQMIFSNGDTPIDPTPGDYPVLYLKGADINGAEEWGTQYKMTESNGVYTISGITLGTSFKIADADWSNDDNYGSNGSALELGQPYTVGTGSSSANIEFADGILSVESATVEFNYDAQTITVTGEPVYGTADWYLCGINDEGTWMFPDSRKFVATSNDEFVLAAFEVTVATGGFQVSTKNYTQQFGGASVNITNENPSAELIKQGSFGENANYDLTLGTYKVTWNASTHVISFTMTSSSIENIGAEAAAAPAEYFDVYGRKVSEPRGLVIKVQDGKASKVIL